jgi:hypothetical protein
MTNLNQDTDVLNELNNYRERAKALREQGLNSLKGIDDIKFDPKTKIVETTEAQAIKSAGDESQIIVHNPSEKKGEKTIEYNEVVITNTKRPGKASSKDYGRWIASGNKIETALLVKIQNHRDISDSDDNNNASEAAKALTEQLLKTGIKELFNVSVELEKGLDIQQTVPILTAARILQALSARAENVFSEAAMLCYYRIVRELNFSNGAARAGSGGGKSAFVTSECLRGVLAFEHAIARTVKFLKYTRNLYRKYQDLQQMVESLGEEGKNENHPLRKWAEAAIERMWLDYYLSTNPRSRQIALFFCDDATRKKYGDDNKKPPNQLLISDDTKINLVRIEEYFDMLSEQLKTAFDKAANSTDNVLKIITDFRKEDSPFLNAANAEYPLKERTDYPIKDPKQLREVNFWYQRTQSSYMFAAEAIFNTAEALRAAAAICDQKTKPRGLADVLDDLIRHVEKYPPRIHRIIKPTKDYLIAVIDHETGATESQFDAGELVFAAAAYGTMIGWQINESLTNAVKKIVETLPSNGRIITRKPFHATQRGYRMQPIGCEMTRSLAQLLQHTNFDVTPETVGRLLKIFEDDPIDLDESIDKKQFLGWNFDGAPNPDKPCVWVTAISVLALDRIVRMLNTRINEIVFKHFEVVRPETQQGKMTLNDLIYPDYGLSQGYFPKHKKEYPNQRSSPIYLELMRAHAMRATQPKDYKDKVYSAIFYGPPGTGKTTLAKAMALSAQVPLVMLSPSDLMVKGQQQIEGRARDVFNALSMLTQTAIILDEFDSVLKSRSTKESDDVGAKAQMDIESAIEKGFAAVVKALNEGNVKEDAAFSFLLAGMLPKLTKLHDNAEKQGIVFCLATNYFGKIGEAAGRKGRFDYKIPVYPPCRLSRAGTLLYRLTKIDNKFKILDGNHSQHFIKLVAQTTGENASQLSGGFFKVKEDENGAVEKDKYGKPKCAESLKDIINDKVDNSPLNFEKIESLEKLWKKSSTPDREKKEIEWLANYETNQIDIDTKNPKMPTDLEKFLIQHLE